MYANGKCKAAAVIGYLTPICWIIGYFLREKGDRLSAQHLNQALPLVIIEAIASLLMRGNGLLSVIGEIADLAVAILAIIGIIRALKGSDKPLPYIGKINFIDN